MRTICFAPPTPPEIWSYSGYPRDFDNHRYCQRTYIGEMNEAGEIVPCPCECHQPKQADLFAR